MWLWLWEIAGNFRAVQAEGGKQMRASGVSVIGAGSGPLRSGLGRFDVLTGGLVPGDLVVFGGRPGMGKTAVGLAVAAGVWEQGRPVLMSTLDMLSGEMALRYLMSRVRTTREELGREDTGALAAVRAVHEEAIGEGRVMVRDSLSSVESLAVEAESLGERHGGLGAVIVDSLQMMGCEAHARGSRFEEMSAVVQGLKRLAMAQWVPVVAMSQLTRRSEERLLREGLRGARPRMSDLRDSGVIEDCADVVALLFREDYYEADAGEFEIRDRGVMQLVVAKNRRGPTGILRMAFRGDIGRVDDVIGGKA